MAEGGPTKDATLEALDFIVNVLKEHEKDLDKLISELSNVTEKLGDTDKLGEKVEKIEENINNLQKEISTLIRTLSKASKEPLPTAVKEKVFETSIVGATQAGPTVVLWCKQWEDFQTLAFQAQTLSFSYEEDKKVFEANAIKDNRLINYRGVLPKFLSILKSWLAEQMNIPEKKILEGNLTTR